MCYNCGCGILDEDHGKPNNLTTSKIAQMAKENNMTEEETKENILEALETEDDLEEDEEEEKDEEDDDDEDM